MVGDFDIVDDGPAIPAPDSAHPAEARLEAAAEVQNPQSVQEQPSEITAGEAVSAQAPALAETELDGLIAEIKIEGDAQEADRVLAEVTGEIPLAEAPSLVPPPEPGQGPEPATVTLESDAGADIETVAARRAREALLRRRRWPISGLAAAILALVAVDAALLGWRNDVVRLLPQTASFYAAIRIPVNLRGLAFENIKTSSETEDGVTVLVVEGSVVNVMAKAVEVPRLRLSVRNDSKNEIYTWTAQPERSLLGPAEKLPFRSRLASPPAEARDVLVRFFSRHDMVAGLH
jgi:hypothetical protein